MKKLNFQLLMPLFILSIIFFPIKGHTITSIKACPESHPFMSVMNHMNYCNPLKGHSGGSIFMPTHKFYSPQEVDNNIEKKFKEISTIVGNKLDNLNGDLKDQASKEFLPKTENLQNQIDDLKKQIEDLKSQISNLKKKE